MLSGKWMGRFMSEEKLTQVQEMKKLADAEGITMSQLALAWCLRLKNVSSCIIGATSASQLEENAGASGVSLSDEVLDQIDQITSQSELKLRLFRPAPRPRRAHP